MTDRQNAPRVEGLESAIREGYEHALKILGFGRSVLKRSSGELHPTGQQVVRMYEAAINGTGRLFCADTTSAGKTFTSVSIKGLMDEEHLKTHGRKCRAMVFAPNQGIEGAWREKELNRYARALSLPAQTAVHIDKENPKRLLGYDFILVNYDKLSITPNNTGVNPYVQGILDIIPEVDLFIVDECHQLKNIQSNRASAFCRILERTVGKKFVMLSASPIPNRLRDAGFMLYMFDPARYRHYATSQFDYTQDRYSIMNFMNSGAYFSFTRDDLKKLWSLPELRFGDELLGIGSPHRFELSKRDAERYFEAWKTEEYGRRKVATLSRILLEAEMETIDELIGCVRTREPDAQFSIFSFFKEGFTNEMAEMLRNRRGLRVGVISGDITDVRERLRVAEMHRQHQTDVVICTDSTASESLSLITEDRPSYLIEAEPSGVPSTHEQIIGRLYRIGQHAPVTAIELVPYNRELNGRMTEEVARQRTKGVKYKESWKPGTLFENNHDRRLEKEKLIQMVCRGGLVAELLRVADLGDDEQDARAYSSLPEVADRRKTNQEFNEGLKRVRGFIGHPIEELLDSEERKFLIGSYSLHDWEMTSSADTNRAIAEVIQTIENAIGNSLDNILDWGCGSACLARASARKVHNLDLLEEMLSEGMARTRDIYGGGQQKYFHQGNAKKMPFPSDFFHLVSSSYAMQYNAQGTMHRRDIEEIILETNRVLKDGFYGVFALPNQATTQEDIEALTNVLLPRYGFKVLQSDYITGHARNPSTGRENTVMQGFYLIVYQKMAQAKELAGTDDVFVYAPYKLIGIGGLRKLDMNKRGGNGYKDSELSATIFRGEDRRLLGEKIREILINTQRTP